MEKKLGKGLSALIPDSPKRTENILSIPLDKIKTNVHQPRKTFKPSSLKELTDSIKEKGIIQPVIVRQKDDAYELIAGERRFKAALQLGIAEIPAIVKDVDDSDSLQISLIENIQREQLNPIEEASAYKQLMERFKLSQNQISEAVGKDKTTISNVLRLLALPVIIQEFLQEELLSMGHAKAILALTSEKQKIKYARKAIKKALSVRQIENLIRSKPSVAKKTKRQPDANLRELEEKLQHYFGTRVTIVHGKKRGKLEIAYFSNEDLDRIIKLILDKS